jgi:hypothetical protein
MEGNSTAPEEIGDEDNELRKERPTTGNVER